VHLLNIKLVLQVATAHWQLELSLVLFSFKGISRSKVNHSLDL
jgi:hypothetical protein